MALDNSFSLWQNDRFFDLHNTKGNWILSFDFYEAPSVGRGSSGSVLAIDEELVIKIFSEDEQGVRDFERGSTLTFITQAYHTRSILRSDLVT